MGKLSKRDLKLQREIQELLQKDHITEEERETIYRDYDPSYDSEVTGASAFFSPINLAMDAALFSYRHGHIVDLCSGIGGLSYSLLTRNYHHETIKSITLIEYNSTFSAMSKKLLSPLSGWTHSQSEPIQLNFIVGSAWDQGLWTGVTATLEGGKFNSMVSNPPYGKCTQEEKAEASWMHYQGERDLMAVELAWRYSERATMIMPPMSVEFQYSGRPYYERIPRSKVDRFRKKMPDGFQMHMECDGIDCSIFRDEWKGTSISTEVVDITFDEEWR